MGEKLPAPGFDLKSVRVQFYSVVAAVAVGVSAAISLTIFLSNVATDSQMRDMEIKSDIRELRKDISVFKSELTDLTKLVIVRTDDRLRRTDMEVWLNRLARENPTLNVPHVGNGVTIHRTDDSPR